MRAAFIIVLACAVTGCIFDQGSYEGGGRRGRIEPTDSGTGPTGTSSSSSSSSAGGTNPPADAGPG